MALILRFIFISALLLAPCSSDAFAKNVKKKSVSKFTPSKLNVFDRYATQMAAVRDAVDHSKELDAKRFPKELLDAIFQAYQTGTSRILASSRLDSISKLDREEAQFYKSALEKLDFEEQKVDQISDQVRAHFTELGAKVFKKRVRVSLEYISWQTEATLKGPFENTPLLSNNLGICPGIGMSYENRFWAFSADLNGLYGSGGVSTTGGTVTYQQSDVPAFGGKFSLGVARVVASSGSELGLRGSILYIKQTLTTPSSPGYSISQDKTLSETITLFSRWRFSRFYFQTDFGRYVGRPATLWAFGAGFIL